MGYRLDSKKAPQEDKKHIVSLSHGYTDKCDQTVDRTQAYSLAAVNLGIGLSSSCKAFKLLNISSKRVKDALHTEEVPFVCFRMKGDKPVGRVGVPAKNYEVVFRGGTDWEHAVQLKIEVPSQNLDNGDETDIILQDLTDDASQALEANKLRLARYSSTPRAKLNAEGMGKFLKSGTNGSDIAEAIATLSPEAQPLLYDQVMRMYGVSASLFDSDVAEAALMGVQARQGLSLFAADDVPQEFTLFARCVIVFHGMIADVVKENAMRLVPISSLQWLLRSWGDRFFSAWKEYADDFIEASQGQCNKGIASGQGTWKDLEL